jgi:hypothetical protein
VDEEGAVNVQTGAIGDDLVEIVVSGLAVRRILVLRIDDGLWFPVPDPGQVGDNPGLAVSVQMVRSLCAELPVVDDESLGESSAEKLLEQPSHVDREAGDRLRTCAEVKAGSLEDGTCQRHNRLVVVVQPTKENRLRRLVTTGGLDSFERGDETAQSPPQGPRNSRQSLQLEGCANDQLVFGDVEPEFVVDHGDG